MQSIKVIVTMTGSGDYNVVQSIKKIVTMTRHNAVLSRIIVTTVLNFLNEVKQVKATCIYKSFCEIELYLTIGI